MADSPEVRMAIQDERMKTIMENLQQSRFDQKEMSQQLNKVLSLLITVEARIKALEENRDKNTEMHEEFTQLKHEVVGAKRVIRWLWALLAGLTASGIAVIRLFM